MAETTDYRKILARWRQREEEELLYTPAEGIGESEEAVWPESAQEAALEQERLLPWWMPWLAEARAWAAQFQRGSASHGSNRR
ncbi:MAG: hypothetical protein AB7N91_15375 [Candidatus Tectimicrobiota bacterium]